MVAPIRFDSRSIASEQEDKMKESNTNQITALYCRLSQEDLRAGESLSIENQRLLLKEYADKNGFKNCQYYIDDGYSGVNKNSPEYVRMLKDIESGLVGTVIVKDGKKFLTPRKE